MKPLLVALTLALPLAAQAAGFSLDSAELKHDKPIPETHVFKGFGCEGGNASPSLAWKNPPKDTKSFAVTVYDPDAPTGSGWWHWVVFNLPADAAGLAAGAGDPGSGKAPKGAMQSRTDFGKPGWGGPCPPKGDKPHRYIFTVHALKVEKLDLDENATAALVGFMINANRLGKASFTATYGRK
jgi:Raf kinase inhibitor-like YbhB/YbcL family protein